MKIGWNLSNSLLRSERISCANKSFGISSWGGGGHRYRLFNRFVLCSIGFLLSRNCRYGVRISRERRSPVDPRTKGWCRKLLLVSRQASRRHRYIPPKTIRIVSAILLLSAVIGSVHATAPPVPTGVFYMPSGKTIDSNALDHADGVIVGGAWSDLEPNYHEYVFNESAEGESLEQQLHDVEVSNGGAGKPIKLIIATGGPGVSDGGSKPDWLIDEIANDNYGSTPTKFFSYIDKDTDETVTIPVFWEPTLLAKHADLVSHVADYILANHPLVTIVYVPYANSNTDDWNLGDIRDVIDGVDPLDSTPHSRWKWAADHSPYDSMADALVGAGRKTFEAYHNSFPDQILTTSVGTLKDPELNPNQISITQQVVTYKNDQWGPGYVAAQKNNLNGGEDGVPQAPGVGSDWNELYVLAHTYNIPTAAQMVWHAYKDSACGGEMDNYFGRRMNAGNHSDCEDSTQMLYQAVAKGLGYFTKWQEIYELDMLHLGGSNHDTHIPDQDTPSDVIEYAHEQLYNPDEVMLTGMVSRLVHGTTVFDIDLFGGAGVACRSAGSSSAYTIIMTFANNLSNVCSVSATCGSAAGSYGPNANQYTVTLSSQSGCNAQYNQITLTGVDDTLGNHSDAVVSPMWGLLLGDVTGDGMVVQVDVTATSMHTGQTLNSMNCRYDVNLNGSIGMPDVNAGTSKLNTSLLCLKLRR